MRKARFFQKDAYISIDYLSKKVEVVKMEDAPENIGSFDMVLENAQGAKKRIYFDNPEVAEVNAIQMELECFAKSICTGAPVIVPMQQGLHALDIALQVSALVEKSAK